MGIHETARSSAQARNPLAIRPVGSGTRFLSRRSVAFSKVSRGTLGRGFRGARGSDPGRDGSGMGGSDTWTGGVASGVDFETEGVDSILRWRSCFFQVPVLRGRPRTSDVIRSPIFILGRPSPFSSEGSGVLHCGHRADPVDSRGWRWPQLGHSTNKDTNKGSVRMLRKVGNEGHREKWGRGIQGVWIRRGVPSWERTVSRQLRLTRIGPRSLG